MTMMSTASVVLLLAHTSGFLCSRDARPGPALRAAVATSSDEELFQFHRDMMPPVQRLALEGAPTEPTELLQSLFATDHRTQSAAAAALRAAALSEEVRTSAALAASECAAMRRWFDKKVGTRADVDNVDGLPKFQVNLEERKLREVVGHDGADRLLALPAVLFGLARPPALDSAFIRRYTRETRSHMPFHVDGNSFTANIALTPPEAHEGGDLVALAAGACHKMPRRLGEATVHGGHVCHAVSPVTAGERYSLLMFFR